MFIYIARGGATVLTKIQAHPFTDARKESRKKGNTIVEALGGASLPPGLDAKIKKLADEKDLKADDGASIAVISLESTYETISAKVSFSIKDLGAPSTCRVTTTPTWASFDCPTTKGKVTCDNTPDPNYKSRMARLGAFLTRKGEPATELNRDEGMVVHDFKTVGCAEGNWERVVPSPYDEDPDLTNDERLATMPFLSREVFNGIALTCPCRVRIPAWGRRR
jgi:hypothetical protein